MTIQIAVRLQNDAVQHIDAEVAAGRAKSRADYLDRLVAKERRRRRSLEDLERLRTAGLLRGGDAVDELDAVARATSTRSVDLD